MVELDKAFWETDLRPKPLREWIDAQMLLVAKDSWILDGDLGPYDAPGVRIKAADTILVLDLPRWLCLFRSARRSKERMDYWAWIWSWTRKHKPKLMAEIGSHAQTYVFHSQNDVEQFLSKVEQLSGENW
jgi:hypothetical protein